MKKLLFFIPFTFIAFFISGIINLNAQTYPPHPPNEKDLYTYTLTDYYGATHYHLNLPDLEENDYIYLELPQHDWDLTPPYLTMVVDGEPFEIDTGLFDGITNWQNVYNPILDITTNLLLIESTEVIQIMGGLENVDYYYLNVRTDLNFNESVPVNNFLNFLNENTFISTDQPFINYVNDYITIMSSSDNLVIGQGSDQSVFSLDYPQTVDSPTFPIQLYFEYKGWTYDFLGLTITTIPDVGNEITEYYDLAPFPLVHEGQFHTLHLDPLNGAGHYRIDELYYRYYDDNLNEFFFDSVDYHKLIRYQSTYSRPHYEGEGITYTPNFQWNNPAYLSTLDTSYYWPMRVIRFNDLPNYLDLHPQYIIDERATLFIEDTPFTLDFIHEIPYIENQPYIIEDWLTYAPSYDRNVPIVWTLDNKNRILLLTRETYFTDPEGLFTTPRGFGRQIQIHLPDYPITTLEIDEILEAAYNEGWQDFQNYIHQNFEQYFSGRILQIIEEAEARGYQEGLDATEGEAFNRGYEAGAEDSFLANFDVWIVPAIIIVLIVGGFLSYRRGWRAGDE